MGLREDSGGILLLPNEEARQIKPKLVFGVVFKQRHTGHMEAPDPMFASKQVPRLEIRTTCARLIGSVVVGPRMTPGLQQLKVVQPGSLVPTGEVALGKTNDSVTIIPLRVL